MVLVSERVNLGGSAVRPLVGRSEFRSNSNFMTTYILEATIPLQEKNSRTSYGGIEQDRDIIIIQAHTSIDIILKMTLALIVN